MPCPKGRYGKKVDVNQNSNRLMRQLYFRLLPAQILVLFINTINVFIDGLITSRYLGTEAMAAIGLFTPATTLLGMSYVLIRGIWAGETPGRYPRCFPHAR